MSGSITGTQTLTQAAQAAAAANAASASGTASSSSSSSSSSTGTNTTNTALASLGANFNQFLQLLLTQVQNQDPTSPTDTTQFTTELVQFTGVQEQVDANSSLNQLISLQQSSQVLQSANIVGDTAQVSANQISLQNGSGEVAFNTAASEPVAIAIVDQNGNAIYNTTVQSNTGANTWQWNGQSNSGAQEPDGAYSIALETASSSGSATAVPFSVLGTATGISTSGTTTALDLGALSVPLSAVQALGQGSAQP